MNVTTNEIRTAALEVLKQAARTEAMADELRAADVDTLRAVSLASSSMTVAEAGRIDEAVQMIRDAQDEIMRLGDLLVAAGRTATAAQNGAARRAALELA